MSATGNRVTARLSGWGANRHSECSLVEPETEKQVAAGFDRSGTIARGLGRSYGDAATNSGGQVVRTTRLDRCLEFDEANGRLSCEAGVSLALIIQLFAPRGWFPMITPGTKFVTVGGCIANDVHGKGHHAQGSFSNCVDSMLVLLASGEVLTASRHENAALFWGTFGGMGLLGIVLSATIRLRKIETTYFSQKAIQAADLAAMLRVFDEHDQAFPYSVATLDVLAKGPRLGRGVVVVGDHATQRELPQKFAGNPLRVSGPPSLAVPFNLPELTLNPLSIRALNSLILWVQARTSAFGHYDGFVYPLDVLADWNRGYGRRGFTQYQFVIPLTDGLERMREILNAIFQPASCRF